MEFRLSLYQMLKNLKSPSTQTEEEVMEIRFILEEKDQAEVQEV